MNDLIKRAKRFKRAPLEQLAYEAWRDHSLLAPSHPDSPRRERQFWRAWNEYAAVKEGRAEPLPMYRQN